MESEVVDHCRAKNVVVVITGRSNKFVATCLHYNVVDSELEALTAAILPSRQLCLCVPCHKWVRVSLYFCHTFVELSIGLIQLVRIC